MRGRRPKTALTPRMTTINDALKQLRGEGLFAQVFSTSGTEIVIDCSIYITDLETGAALQVDPEENCDGAHSVGKAMCPLCGEMTRDLIQKQWRGVFHLEDGHAEQLVWKTGPYLPKEMGKSMGQKICAILS